MPIMGGVESGTLINNLIKADLEAQKAKKMAEAMLEVKGLAKNL